MRSLHRLCLSPLAVFLAPFGVPLQVHRAGTLHVAVLRVFLPLVQALDMLTPLGRGQALLVTGMQQSGKTSLVLDAVLGQYRSGVRCIYAAIGQR